MKNNFPTVDKIGALIGIIVGVVCGLGIPIYFAIKFNDLYSLITPSIFIAVFGIIFYSQRSTFASIFGSRTQKYILENGILTEAVVKEVRDTGITINNGLYFMVDLVLDVKSGDRPTYQAEAGVMVSRINVSQYQPGMTVKIKIHPEKSERVELVD